jgi:SAM-dependent methyltransferase
VKKDFLWLNLRELPYFRGTLRSVEARLMAPVLLPPPTIDIGAGDGHFAATTYSRMLDAGIDPSLASLQEAKGRRAYRLLLQAGGARLPFADQSFASAISNSVLEHIPSLQPVLNEVGRVLQPGAPFAITVPNPGYRSQLSLPAWLRRIGLRKASAAYAGWFMRMSRTVNLLDEPGWAACFERAGFGIESSQAYFSPAALHMLEWGHFLGAPTLLPRMLLRRWIIAPTRWNLMLTDKLVRRYYLESPPANGTYTFYLARKR